MALRNTPGVLGKVLLLPGDGIGPEVMREVRRVMDWFARRHGLEFELDEGIKLAYLGLVASNYLTDRIDAARAWMQRMVPILSSYERDRYLASLSEQFPLLGLPGS